MQLHKYVMRGDMGIWHLQSASCMLRTTHATRWQVLSLQHSAYCACYCVVRDVSAAAWGRCRWGFCGWSFLPSNSEVLAVEDLSTDARHAPQT